MPATVWTNTLAVEKVKNLRGVSAVLGEAMAGSTRRIEFPLRAADGEVRPIVADFFPVIDGTCVIAIDATDEQAMRERMAHLDQLQMLGTLAGGIAHDFNNLLCVILGNLYMVELELPRESSLRVLTAAAREASQSGAELARQLSAYARPRGDRAETVDVSAVLEATLRMAGASLHGIDIAFEKCGQPVLVRGQQGALQQVFLNLVMNARDAMPGDGRLAVSCSLANPPGPDSGLEWWTIRIEDNGCGIDAAHLSRIFDPFFTTKDPDKGTGLGLAICDTIVRRHGGSITVESRPGRTVFAVTLPAAPEAAQTSRAQDLAGVARV